MTEQEKTPRQVSVLKLKIIGVIRVLLMIMILGGVLFLSSGEIMWIQAWSFMGIVFINSVFMYIAINPNLLRERTVLKKDAKQWDIPLVKLMVWVGPLSTFIVAGLDKRFVWSLELGMETQIAAFFLCVLGLVFNDWAMFTNKFFSALVRIQKDRGHHVIDTGPYSFVRHPGYTGSIVFNITTPLILGSLWAYFPVIFTVIITIIRTSKEDKTLQNELEGYLDYSSKVSYRLCPGLW